CAAWVIWSAALGMTLLATTGFAATNIGDALSGRTKIAEANAALAARIGTLRGERAGIAEIRSVATIDAALQAAQPRAAAVWRATVRCTDVTLPESGRACADVLALRQARGAAVRRDSLDAELRESEATLAGLPAVSTGDPQAAMAADIVA